MEMECSIKHSDKEDEQRVDDVSSTTAAAVSEESGVVTREHLR